MIINQKEIQSRDELVNNKLLRRAELDNLVIYTYTDKCVYEKKWDQITLNSRGHIFDRNTGQCVALPFAKFFNLNEREETKYCNLPWDLGFKAYEKMDGWLGILYRHDNKYQIATRGSFTSPGAVWATNFLNKEFPNLSIPEELTLLFEIISPETKIIVNYETADLVLIGIYNRFTGEELGIENFEYLGFPICKQTEFKNCNHIQNYIKMFPGNELEGFVVRFNNGLRIKIKSEDYMNRSAILQQITPRGLWKLMLNGRVNADYLYDISQEYLDIALTIIYNLENEYKKIKLEIENDFAKIFVDNETRKNFSEKAKAMRHVGAMFSILDNKVDAVDKYILEVIKPC